MMQWAKRIFLSPLSLRTIDAVGRIEGGGALDHADLALARQSGKAPSQLADDFVLVGAQRPQVDFRCKRSGYRDGPSPARR